ncbi:MAG: hypothetical protein U0M37_05450 [Blautia sp.]
MEKKVKNVLEEKLELSSLVEEKILETYEMIRIREKAKASGKISEISNREADKKTGGDKRKKKSEKVFWRTGLAVAAVFLISGGAVFAYDALRKPDLLSEWIQERGIKQEREEELVQEKAEIVYKTKPILRVRDVYIDGTNLVFTAVSSEKYKNVSLKSKDHGEINGQDCSPVDFLEEAGEYMCRLPMPENLISKKLTVLLDLDVPGGTEEFSFEVKAENMEETKRIQNQTIEFSEGAVEVEKFTISPSVTCLKFYWIFSEEPSEEMKQTWGHTYKIYNEKGECEDIGYGGICLSTETGEWEEKNGRWMQSVELELKADEFLRDSSFIKLVPYIPEIDEEGKRIPGGQMELFPECGFTILIE